MTRQFHRTFILDKTHYQYNKKRYSLKLWYQKQEKDVQTFFINTPKTSKWQNKNKSKHKNNIENKGVTKLYFWQYTIKLSKNWRTYNEINRYETNIIVRSNIRIQRKIRTFRYSSNSSSSSLRYTRNVKQPSLCQ